MTIEQIIQRYQQRGGFRLADYAEVALPIYTLNVLALTLAHRRLPPIEEFVLKCLALNLSSTNEMSRFLGLEEEVLKSALVSLAQTESIALTAPHGKQSWALTQKGRGTLETAELVSPEERVFSVHFDAITRKPTLYRFQTLLKHKELAEEGLKEIEQIPPKRPQPSEITPLGIERILKSIPGSIDQMRDVLAVRSLENVKKFYIRGVALIFRSTEGNDIQIGFVIDGQLSTEHELVFARSEGLSRLSVSLSPDAEEKKELDYVAATGKLWEASQKLAEQIQASTDTAATRVAETTQALEAAETAQERDELREKLKLAEEELTQLRDKAKQLHVRNLYVLDHPPLLDEALRNAKSRLLIISPWIKRKVVNQDFIKRLDHLLAGGVQVYIGYGIKEQVTQDALPQDVAAVQQLADLGKRFPNFCFKRLGNTHAKVLIKDSEFAAVTSFNWLSFKGDPNRTFRDEQGTLLQKPDLVDQKFAELVARFEIEATASS